MANELKKEVKQAILGLDRQGLSQRRLVHELGVHRKTVRRLLEEQSGSGASKHAIVMTSNLLLPEGRSVFVVEPYKGQFRLSGFFNSRLATQASDAFGMRNQISLQIPSPFNCGYGLSPDLEHVGQS